MKFSFSRFLVFTIAATLLIPQASAQLVEIPDPNLRRAVRETLALPDEIPLNQQEMLRLKRLSAWDSEIADLTGLEHATFLINLGLCGNQIHDLRPLAGLVQLEGLSLCVNQITDISPLTNLTNLKELDLGANRIVDITPLANLTRLERINLGSNLIEDITSLSNLTQLTYLRLDANQIRDISPLANLTSLEELEIRRNAITDITPLIELKNLKKLRLADNPVHDFRPLLELEGVELDLDIELSRLDELNTMVEVPDPNLRQAIREALSLPEDVPLTQQQMLRLKRLSAWNSEIIDLTGLEHATFLRSLGLCDNQIHDLRPLSGLIHLEHLALCFNQIENISPLTNLTNLKHLDFGLNQISDISPLTRLIKLETLNLHLNQVANITPLANLTQLFHLNLSGNLIVDFIPLANLINLRELFIERNLGTDFSSLQGLDLTEFRYDEVCEMPPFLPPVRERIESRSFPSIFQAWNDVVGLDHLTWEQRNVLHDLHWNPTFNGAILWDATSIEPAAGVATSLAGPLARAREIRQRRFDQNSNMIFLGGAANTAYPRIDEFPPDSDLWLRDVNGEILRKKSDGQFLINFVKPEFQDLLAKRIIAYARCGLYDGIMLDEFNYHGAGFEGRHLYPYTDKEIIQAYTNIFREVRKQVRDDFLIIINAGRSKPMHYAEYVNGIFMETGTDYPYGYTHGGLYEIENTLLWSEENLRSPQINCLEGWGVGTEPPDSPNNLRWMRVFTTMSLTHSDGYVMYNIGRGGMRRLGYEGRREPGHAHLWYPFWDANLGYPVGPKAQLYQNIPGIFIREFTNGWAVYNRSGQPQTISLPESAIAVGNGDLRSATTFLLPDLDGEIYLTLRSFADVNNDGRVNVLDLVQVANGLGKSTPDPNGDGTVNILDLVFVAQQFSQ